MTTQQAMAAIRVAELMVAGALPADQATLCVTLTGLDEMIAWVEHFSHKDVLARSRADSTVLELVLFNGAIYVETSVPPLPGVELPAHNPQDMVTWSTPVTLEQLRAAQHALNAAPGSGVQ